MAPSARWSQFHDWQVDRRSKVPLAQQIYMQVRRAALAGKLSPGAELPSTRIMAKLLGVARGSVVGAYAQLVAESIIESRQGAGTFISSDLSHLVPRRSQRPAARTAKLWQQPTLLASIQDFESAAAFSETRPFNTGRTLVDARTKEAWRRLMHQAAKSLGPDDFGYGDPRGAIELRSSICEYLRAARAVDCDPDQVIITAGTQHAIDIVIRVLLSPGDEAWVEDPGYPLTHAQLLAAKVRPIPVPVDRQGLIVESGLRTARNARAAFVTPSHQFPTCVVLSMARRLELLEWARKSGAFIIEDDYTSEFRYSGPPLASMQGLDQAGRVIYVGTLNKALFPGLRMGYVVVPSELLPNFTATRFLLDRQPPTLQQAAVAEFMSQGHFAAHIRRMRHMYRKQRDAVADTLARHASSKLEIEIPDQGMHLVAHLRHRRDDTEIQLAAARAGIIVRAMSRFYHSAPPRSGLMLGFSGFQPSLIVPAAARLARMISGR